VLALFREDDAFTDEGPGPAQNRKRFPDLYQVKSHFDSKKTNSPKGAKQIYV